LSKIQKFFEKISQFSKKNMQNSSYAYRMKEKFIYASTEFDGEA
jgi:hypothetical protein